MEQEDAGQEEDDGRGESHQPGEAVRLAQVLKGNDRVKFRLKIIDRARVL